MSNKLDQLRYSDLAEFAEQLAIVLEQKARLTHDDRESEVYETVAAAVRDAFNNLLIDAKG